MNNAGDGDVVAVAFGHSKIDVRMISALASNRYCAVDAVRWRFPAMPLRIVQKRVAWLGTRVVVENLASFSPCLGPLRPTSRERSDAHPGRRPARCGRARDLAVSELSRGVSKEPDRVSKAVFTSL